MRIDAARMLLLGTSWELERFARVAQCALPALLHSGMDTRTVWRGGMLQGRI